MKIYSLVDARPTEVSQVFTRSRLVFLDPQIRAQRVFCTPELIDLSSLDSVELLDPL
jgi:hypothetical protein